MLQAKFHPGLDNPAPLPGANYWCHAGAAPPLIADEKISHTRCHRRTAIWHQTPKEAAPTYLPKSYIPRYRSIRPVDTASFPATHSSIQIGVVDNPCLQPPASCLGLKIQPRLCCCGTTYVRILRRLAGCAHQTAEFPNPTHPDKLGRSPPETPQWPTPSPTPLAKMIFRLISPHPHLAPFTSLRQ